MEFSEFEKLVKSRQSCRSFSNKPVDGEMLEKIVRLALLSPSACNSQPWSFDIVNTPGLALELAKCTQEMGMNKFASLAPAFITVCEEKATLSERVGMKFKDTDFVANDLGIACAHIVLAAKSMGLDTCILGWLSHKKIAKLLNYPKERKVRLVIAIGYGDEKNTLRDKKRKPGDKTLRLHY